MRILLAQNSLYYPAHGGGDKSNRLLIEALAASGHECRVIARTNSFGETDHARYLVQLAERGITAPRTDGHTVSFTRAGVDVHIVTNANLRALFTQQLEAFQPDIVLCSTDDPAQVLLEPALLHQHARVVYLARATLALPFGPDCAFPNPQLTGRIRACDAVVAVSEYVARYIREHAGIDAVHVPISLIEPGESWPQLGRFENEFVTFVNPCAVKGIAIFLALAGAFPNLTFAAVPTWGTTPEDRASLEAHPNIRILDPVDDIDLILARTRILLVPSLWAEARSRIILEAMLRGVPVIASEVGGIPEAKMGVPYLLPVNPIRHYDARLDSQMVPVADVPPQDPAPWIDALRALTTEPALWQQNSAASRRAALDYAANLNAGHFESLLESLPAKSSVAAAQPRPAKPDDLSPEKRKLLGVLLRKRASSAKWFPNADAVEGRRLFWFPHAGGSAASYPGGQKVRSDLGIVGVELPGRGNRSVEPPFTRMTPLVTALADAIDPYLDRPFAFFGHSMGAAVAFELARELRRRHKPLPTVLIASAARAPQFRRNHKPKPAPSREEFIAELRRLGGFTNQAWESTPSLLASLLHRIEADAALFRHYLYTEDAPFDFPIRAYGGLEDENVERRHLEAWSEQTTAGFRLRQFPGGHFYHNELATTFVTQFLSALREDLC